MGAAGSEAGTCGTFGCEVVPPGIQHGGLERTKSWGVVNMQAAPLGGPLPSGHAQSADRSRARSGNGEGGGPQRAGPGVPEWAWR